MRIRIASCLAGARSVEGVAVIIDVFRAGNTAAALVAAGAPFIVPVAELDQARELKKQHPDWLLVGERGGLKPEGFDLNNSPAEVLGLKAVRTPAVMTTSAGTRGLTAAAPKAEALFMATLINARAAASLIRTLAPEAVTLVPIGLNAREPAEEDEVVAGYLAALIRGETGDYRTVVRAMLKGSGAARLRRLGQWRDLAFCLRLDRFDLVPQALVRNGRLVLVAAGKS